MKKKNKICIALLITTVLFILLPLCVHGQGEIDFSEFEDSIPDSIKKYLPDDVVSADDPSKIIDEFDVEFFSKVAFESFREAIKSSLKIFSQVLGIIIITSVLSAMKSSFKNEGINTVFDLVSAAAVILCIYGIIYSQFEMVAEMIRKTSAFLSGAIPVMSMILIAGGNITTAAVTNGNMVLTVGLLNVFCEQGLIPLLRVCFGLTIASHISKNEAIATISDFIRNTFTFILVFAATIISIIMSMQTNVAQGADTVATRTIKFAAGSAIPVVGGALGDAIRTVLGSLSLIKSVTGVMGIVIILLITLPTVISLFAGKISIAFSAVIARMVGSESIAKLLSDTAKLINFTIAAAVIFNLLAIFDFAVFINIVFGAA